MLNNRNYIVIYVFPDEITGFTKLKNTSGKSATLAEVFFICRFRGGIRAFIRAFKGRYEFRMRFFLRSIFYSRYFLI